MDFNFKRNKLSLQKAQYSNGRIALLAVMKKTGARYGMLTCNTPEVELEKGEFAVKVWGENKDLSQVLYNTGVFDDTCKRLQFEHVTAEVWKFVNPNMLEEIPAYRP